MNAQTVGHATPAPWRLPGLRVGPPESQVSVLALQHPETFCPEMCCPLCASLQVDTPGAKLTTTASGRCHGRKGMATTLSIQLPGKWQDHLGRPSWRRGVVERP